jgi:hypothetical protein
MEHSISFERGIFNAPSTLEVDGIEYELAEANEDSHHLRIGGECFTVENEDINGLMLDLCDYVESNIPVEGYSTEGTTMTFSEELLEERL